MKENLPLLIIVTDFLDRQGFFAVANLSLKTLRDSIKNLPEKLGKENKIIFDKVLRNLDESSLIT